MATFLLIAAILIVSAFLAYRSMRDYYDIPSDDLSYSLFLVREKLDTGAIEQIYGYALELNAIISFERLFKGFDSAVVVYCPKTLASKLKGLNLLELEDYLQCPEGGDKNPKDATTVNEATAWPVGIKDGPKDFSHFNFNFLSDINLGQSEFFFWQIVAAPLKNPPNSFQTTIRAMVAEKDPAKRVSVSKTIQNELLKFGLQRKDQQPSAKNFNGFCQRSLIPREVSAQILDAKSVLELIG